MVKEALSERKSVVSADPNLNGHSQASESGDRARADLLCDLYPIDLEPEVDQERYVSAVTKPKIEHPLPAVALAGRGQVRITPKEGPNNKFDGIDVLRIARSVEDIVGAGELTHHHDVSDIARRPEAHRSRSEMGTFPRARRCWRRPRCFAPRLHRKESPHQHRSSSPCR